MKAKNILDKNLTWKNIICYEKIAKNWFFTIFAFSFNEIFFFVTQIFRKILYTPPNFFFIHVFYRWQRKITWRLDTPNLITRRMASDRMTVVLIPPPPGWLGLMSPTSRDFAVSYFLPSCMVRCYLIFDDMFRSCFLIFSIKQLGNSREQEKWKESLTRTVEKYLLSLFHDASSLLVG